MRPSSSFSGRSVRPVTSMPRTPFARRTASAAASGVGVGGRGGGQRDEVEVRVGGRVGGKRDGVEVRFTLGENETRGAFFVRTGEPCAILDRRSSILLGALMQGRSGRLVEGTAELSWRPA